MTKTCSLNPHLAEEIEVTEEHVHTEVICAGDDGANGFEDGGVSPWQVQAAAVGPPPVQGTEVLIYSGALGADVYLDIDRIFVTAVQSNNNVYVINLWAGGGAFGVATRATAAYVLKISNVGSLTAIQGKCPRIRGDLNIWATVSCANANQTLDFLLEYHKYPSDSGDEIES
jgi:hypothetical protein